MDIDNIVICNKICSGEKNFKYFIGYMDDDYTIKRLRIMLPKSSTYVKVYDDKTKWMYFLIKDNEIWKKKVFGIKSAIV